MNSVRSRVALGIAATTLFVATVGHAQPSSPEGNDAPPEYATLIDEGLAESASHHWAEARALFRRAHQIFPNARTLRVIGMTSYELRDYPEAYRMLRASLVDTRRPLTDTQRAEVGSLLERTQELLGRYSLDEFPTEARILVDGVAVHVEPGDELVLGTGDHSVDVRWGTERAVGHWTVQGGERGPLPVTRLERETSSDVTPAPVPSTRDRRTRRIVGISTAAGGAVLAGVGTFFVVRGNDESSNVDDAPVGTPWSSVRADFENGPRHVRTGAVLLGVGLAAVSIGIVVAVRRPDERPPLTVRVGPGTLSTEVRF